MIKKFLAILLSLTAVAMFCFSFVGCNDNSINNQKPTDMAVKIVMFHHNTTTDLIFDEDTNETRIVLNPTALPVKFWIDSVGIKMEPDPKIPDIDLKANKFLSYEWFGWRSHYNKREDLEFIDSQEIIFTNPYGEILKHKEVIIDKGEYEVTWKIKFVMGEKVRERTLKIYLLLPYYS